ncbi:MAG: hypothetical protein CVU88_00930 [Firmicutes bacterium HGW-Firmicutes-13]|nr:MAG: hypothetical protein CVU88_00930 [Firmicutes bacterium HGW-Firmicutes-13]
MDNLDKRFWEIDFLRGLAITMMIIYHSLYNLNYFGSFNFNLQSGFWLFFTRFGASIFIFLVGLSLTLSFSRQIKNIESSGAVYLKICKRGLKIFFWGLLVTLVTRIFIREGFVVFGILHFIGISIILSFPFLRLRHLNILIGFLLILLGAFIGSFRINFPWLLWLGLKTNSFYSIDYFPFLPWFGVILIGIFFGNVLYPGYTRKYNLCDLSSFSIVRLLRFLGRNSLLIYLIHQPVIISLLYLSGVVS